MTDQHSNDLVDRLTDARLGSVPLEMDELPGALDAAQALQVRVLDQVEAAGQTISGWKIGLTSGHAYDMMGVGVRPFGYILAERTLASGSALTRVPGAPMFIEPEICLEIDRPLSGSDLTADQCREAVRSVKAAFEINQSRVRMPGRNHLFVADGLSNWGLTLGDGVPPAAAPLRPPVELFRDGERIASSDPDLVMDDPFVSLATLCNRLARYGRGIAAGQHVITGAFFRQPIETDGTYRAVFHGLGEVSLTIG